MRVARRLWLSCSGRGGSRRPGPGGQGERERERERDLEASSILRSTPRARRKASQKPWHPPPANCCVPLPCHHQAPSKNQSLTAIAIQGLFLSFLFGPARDKGHPFIHAQSTSKCRSFGLGSPACAFALLCFAAGGPAQWQGPENHLLSRFSLSRHSFVISYRCHI